MDEAPPYEGQLSAMRSFAAGRSSVSEFDDAFWRARNVELDANVRHTWLDAILDPVSELLMVYEDDYDSFSESHLLETVRDALARINEGRGS